MKKNLSLVFACFLLLYGCGPTGQRLDESDSETIMLPATDHLTETRFSNEDMLRWNFTGRGSYYIESGRQLCLQEDENSTGVTLFSRDGYAGDVVLRYKIMTLNAATVVVNLLCVSDVGDALVMTLPADYDGGMAPVQRMENYFVAFRNSPHLTAPFITKNPEGKQLVIAEKDEMLPGVYYDIEVGRVGTQLWLEVDDRVVISTEDPRALAGGHIGIRLRGLVGYPAACILRDVSILHR